MATAATPRSDAGFALTPLQATLADLIRELFGELEARAAEGEPYNQHFRSEAGASILWLCLNAARRAPGDAVPPFPGDRSAKPPGKRKARGTSIFDAVKAAVSVEELAGRYTKLKQAGPGKLKGLCPLHTEKTPSFYVLTDREPQSWRCFGACAAGGDVISLAQELMNCGKM